MNKILIGLTFVLISCEVFSETGYRSGTVEYVRVHDDSSGETWKTPVFWFTLNGVSSAGGCPNWNGNTLFVANSEQAYSMILAVYMSGKEVAVQYDDAYVNQANYCIAKHVTVGSPPPNF